MTTAMLSVFVLLPIAAIGAALTGLGPGDIVAIIRAPRVLGALELSIGSAFAAATADAVAGALIAWVIVRYRFAGREVLNALIDIPFALPTAVSGIALAALYADTGWFGKIAAAAGVRIAYTPIGIWIALTFVGLPFVVRTLAPVLEALPVDLEEAAAVLGAGPLGVARSVISPLAVPALLAGFGMAFARQLGEYGSIIFISGNIPGQTEIAPLLIVSTLEQNDRSAAAAVAIVMLAISFAALLTVNRLRKRSLVSATA